jgi:MFS transporter, DHA3 family, macrolide efflux protein
MNNNSIYSFIILWLGQGFSLIGSRITTFALIFWIWDATAQTSSLSLLWFFQQLPQIFVAPLAGYLVDRYPRKLLMILGDSIAVLSTIFLLFQQLNQQLTVTDLYITTFINACFGSIQELAYTTTIPLMIPSHQFDRANSLEFLAGYGSRIIAPAIAGILYPLIHLQGIFIVDIGTFFIALLTIYCVNIPTIKTNKSQRKLINFNIKNDNLLREIKKSYQYIQDNRILKNLLIMTCFFQFFHDLGDSIYAPLILARTNNDQIIYAQIATSAGIGGVFGALLILTRGGFASPLQGVFVGMTGAGISKIIFGMNNMPLIWIIAQFFSSFHFPILGSAETTIWLRETPLNNQGKIIAFQRMFVLIFSLIAYVLGGFLADYFFIPLMTQVNIFSFVFGVGKSAGINLLYVLSAIALFMIGLWGWYSKKDIN